MMTTMKNWEESVLRNDRLTYGAKAMVRRVESMVSQSAMINLDESNAASFNHNLATMMQPGFSLESEVRLNRSSFPVASRYSDVSDERSTSRRERLERFSGDFQKLSPVRTETGIATGNAILNRKIRKLDSHGVDSGFRNSKALESPETQFQVLLLNMEQSRKDSQLGYRAGDVNIANSDNLIQESKIPMFDGKNLDGWIEKVEIFFSFMSCGDEIKLDLVHFCFEGDALQWFRRVIRRRRFKVWDDFKQELRDQFGHVTCSPVAMNMNILPMFDGNNPSNWILRAETFLRSFSDEDKLIIVGAYLEGVVSKWFSWEMHRRRIENWSDFKNKLLARFDIPVQVCTPQEVIFKRDLIPEVPQKSVQGMNREHEPVQKIYSPSQIHETREVQQHISSQNTTLIQEMDSCSIKVVSNKEVVHEAEVGQVVISPVREETEDTCVEEKAELSQSWSAISNHAAVEKVSVTSVACTTHKCSTLERMLKRDSVPQADQEAKVLQDTAVSKLTSASVVQHQHTKNSCYVDRLEAFQICNDETRQLVQKIESPIREIVSEKSETENVNFISKWTAIWKPSGIHQLFDNMLGQVTIKEQRKCDKTEEKLKRFQHGIGTSDLKEWLCVEHETKFRIRNSHVWHRWKAKVGFKCLLGFGGEKRLLRETIRQLRKRRRRHILQALQQFTLTSGEFHVKHKWRSKLVKFLNVAEQIPEEILSVMFQQSVAITLKGLMLMGRDMLLLQIISSFHHVLGLFQVSGQWFYFRLQPYGSDQRCSQLILHSSSLISRVGKLVLLQTHRSYYESSALILFRLRLRTSLFLRVGVCKGILTSCLIMIVLNWWSSTESEFDLLKKDVRKQWKKEDLITHWLHQVLIQQRQRWKKFYKTRMFKYKERRRQVQLLLLQVVCDLWSISCLIWHRWRRKDYRTCDSAMVDILEWPDRGDTSTMNQCIDPCCFVFLGAVTRQLMRAAEHNMLFSPSLRASLFSLEGVLIDIVYLMAGSREEETH